jgi:transcriptional regulator with XRE-family HTH domain
MRSKTKSQIDRAIGQRLRAYRLAVGMSQSEVGNHLGVTFQQIQKYEKGVNRLSGSRLVAVTELLRVKPEQLLGTNGGGGPSQDEFAVLSDRHINKIVIALNQLSGPQREAVAKSVLSMVRAFGAKV